VLNYKNYTYSFRERLKGKSGIYSFINTINNKQYIGSGYQRSIYKIKWAFK